MFLLFCSVRYHSLHPNYIHDRLKSLGKQYQLRVLLVLVDTVSIGVCVCVCECMIVNECMHIYTCVCVYVCMCVCGWMVCARKRLGFPFMQSESQKVLHELARIALLADLTLILSWRSASLKFLCSILLLVP